jgi:hypothetical protein
MYPVVGRRFCSPYWSADDLGSADPLHGSRPGRCHPIYECGLAHSNDSKVSMRGRVGLADSVGPWPASWQTRQTARRQGLRLRSKWESATHILVGTRSRLRDGGIDFRAIVLAEHRCSLSRQ